MNHKHLIFMTLAFFLSGLLLLSCGITDSSREPGLYYLGDNPLVMSVGDTLSNLKFEKVIVTDARGKKETLENYTKIRFESSDSSLVDCLGNKIIGVKKTTSSITITATETVDNMYSANFKVEVK